MSNKFIVKSRFKNYQVDFMDNLAKSIKANAKKRDFLIIDKKISELYAEKVEKFFAENRIVIVEATEHNKTLENCYSLIKDLVEKDIRKNSIIFALGGGVIEDIAGFISSILFRGINWVFCPTTLLAQADSCIGSKTSINLNEYKNLLGSFYPPSRIFIDTKFLQTLPVDEIKSGIGEILHFYLIAGKDELAKELMNDYERLLKAPEELKDYILSSLKIKKSVIEIDELDEGQRNIFNYGHSFGHAIETVTSYAVNHGQAVTIGMDIANYLSLRLGYIDKETFEYIHQILDKNIPDARLSEKDMEDYFRALSKDKKNIGADLCCILTHAPGSMVKMQLPMDDKFKDMIRSYFKTNF